MDRRALGEELFALLAELVAVPSTFPPGDTTRIAARCADYLAALGYGVERKARRQGVENVLARLGGGVPLLAFNAHADTVDPGERAAWRTDPFRASLVDGHVHGVGACNCKSSMAVHLWLAREIARAGGPKRGEVAFTFVGDEENLGPDGLAYLRDEGFAPQTLVVAAQTRNRLVLEERGVMWVRVVTRGRAAHAGAPHVGDSAILRMNRVIDAFERELMPAIAARRSPSGQQSTFSIGKIRGGENTNVVPDFCAIEIDRRILPEEDYEEAYAEIARTARAAGASEVALLTGTPGFRAPECGAGVQAFTAAILAATGRAPERLNVVGASDGRYFARDGIEIIVFGPGDGADSHIPNEHVALDEIVDAALIQRGVVERLIGV